MIGCQVVAVVVLALGGIVFPTGTILSAMLLAILLLSLPALTVSC